MPIQRNSVFSYLVPGECGTNNKKGRFPAGYEAT